MGSEGHGIKKSILNLCDDKINIPLYGKISSLNVSVATGIFLYIFLHWVSDVNKTLNWYKYIEVAGTATLTCYILPYFFYSFRTLSGIVLPEFFRTGFIGLIKSFI